MFGNQRELFGIYDIYERFKGGAAKKIRKEQIDGTEFEEIVKKYATGKTKTGKDSKSYTLLDTVAIIKECEEKLLSLHLEDLGILLKARNFNDIMGYAGYVSGREEDRNKLYIKDVYPVRRKRDNAVFGYSVITQSIGNGKESRMTVFKRKFDEEPIRSGDIVVCKRWERDGIYFRMLNYEHLIF